MKTVKDLVAEVDAELNAVKAADMGLEACEAFAAQIKDYFDKGDVIQAKKSMDDLANLIAALRKAVPANVIPASAGPVGKSPHEQYLEQARAIVEDNLTKMSEALKGVHEVLGGINQAVGHAVTASAAIQSPDLKDRAA